MVASCRVKIAMSFCLMDRPPAVRRFFLTHGLIVTRLVGLTFVLFGAKSVSDAVQSYRQRA